MKLLKGKRLTPVLGAGNQPWYSGVHFPVSRSTSVFCAVERSVEGEYLGTVIAPINAVWKTEERGACFLLASQLPFI